MLKQGVYCIENISNGKIYIGSSFNIPMRILGHKSLLRRGKSHNAHLQAAYNKYGVNSFVYSILEHCDIDKVKKREEFWINNSLCLINGYNKSKITINNSGWNHTKEYIKNLSENRKGDKNPRYGYKMTIEEKDVVRKNSTGKRHTEEVIKKMIELKAKNKCVGSKLPFAKLNESDIIEIRAIAEKPNRPTFKSIGLLYGVTECSISAIVNRKYWNHI